MIDLTDRAKWVKTPRVIIRGSQKFIDSCKDRVEDTITEGIYALRKNDTTVTAVKEKAYFDGAYGKYFVKVDYDPEQYAMIFIFLCDTLT